MRPHDNLLERLIADAQTDDYALATKTATPERSRLLAFVLLVGIGVLLVAAVAESQSSRGVKAERRADIISRIEQSEQLAGQSQQEVVELRASVSSLQRLASGGLSEGFSDQLLALEIATGFVGLAGPGAVLTMNDASEPLPRGVDPDEARVLDVDMQLAVNGMWEAGADAIAVNDIRLTSTSAIRTAGEAILVDYRPLVPPYRIVAIGPEDLSDRFGETSAAGQLQQLRKDYGIESEVAAAGDLSVPASTANLPETARVVKGGAG